MSDKEDSILLEKRDHIGFITFNRPEKLNALRWEDYVVLDELANDCENDESIRAVILTGKGKAFCVGDDIAAYPGTKKEDLYKADPGFWFLMENRQLDAIVAKYQIPLQKTCTTILTSSKVWITAINGACWAPEILYAMDFVIAADVARIAQGDVRNGICPGGASTQLLPRLLGRRRAIEFLLMAEEISAAEAYRIGMVNKVVPLSELMAESEKLAKKLITRSPAAIKLVKMAVTKAQETPIEQGLEIEQLYCSITMSQSDAFRSFYDKFMAGEFKKKRQEE